VSTIWFLLTWFQYICEWLLFNAKWAVFQLHFVYHVKNKILFLARTCWYLFCTKPTLLSWLFIMLAHWNNSPQVEILLIWHIILKSNPTRLSSYSSMMSSSSEAININIVVFVLTQTGLNLQSFTPQKQVI
jgi:hypothetical protein